MLLFKLLTKSVVLNHRSTEMAVARQWKNGSWMVHWELNGVMDVKAKPSARSASTSTSFTCAGYSYQLNFNDFFTSIDLSLSAPGNCFNGNFEV